MSVTSRIITTERIPDDIVSIPSPGFIQKRDPLAPGFELVIYPGVKAAAIGLVSDDVKQFISSVEFEDNAEQFDVMRINIENQVDSEGTNDILSILDSKLFTEGHIIQLLALHGNESQSIGAASIAKIKPNFPSSSAPSIEIECYDLLHRASKRRPRGGVSYDNFRDSQIASIIGSRNGFEIRTQDPRSFENIQKAPLFKDKFGKGRVQLPGVNDYRFLKKIADSIGFDLFSKFDDDQKKFVLFFQPPARGKQEPVFSFVYNEGDMPYVATLLSFSPVLDAHGQDNAYEIFLIGDKQRQGLTVEPFKQFLNNEQTQLAEVKERRIGGKADSKKPIINDGMQVAFKAYGQSFRFPKHKRFTTAFEIRREIEEFIRRQRENFITGTGSLIGNEFVQSRQVHSLVGLGEQFSGDYYFLKVTHRWGKNSPYTTTFSCRKVIDDFQIQSGPAAIFSANDKKVSKLSKFDKGK